MNWLDDLNQHGYAVLRGVFAPTEMQAVSAAFQRLLERARGMHETTAIDGTQFVISREPFQLKRVVWAGGVEPVLAALGTDPRFLRVAAAALGAPSFVQLIQQAHFKLPGDGVDFGYHQDASNRRYGSELFRDVDGRGSFVQIALAVDPMHSGNGPLRVVPGSHRRGFVADPRTGALPPEDWDAAGAIDLVLAPGDLAVFGPFLIHGSPPNRGSTARRLFLQGYASEGANRRVYPGSGTGLLRTID